MTDGFKAEYDEAYDVSSLKQKLALTPFNEH